MNWVVSTGRVRAAVFIAVIMCCASGCIYSQQKAVSTRPVEAGMEVVVQSAIERHLMDTVGIFHADAHPDTAEIIDKTAAAYATELTRTRPFRSVKEFHRPVKTDTEALWFGRSEGCDLVMISGVAYAMDGTGNLPTHLTVRTRILDARTGMVLWDVKQKAFSEPGPDLDLFWNTISGQSAQRVSELSDTLARQFAGYLVQPLERDK